MDIENIRWLINLIIIGFFTFGFYKTNYFVEIVTKNLKIKMDPEAIKAIATLIAVSIIAITALIVAVIVAIGLILGKIPPKVGASILIAICGGAAIASILRALNKSEKS